MRVDDGWAHWIWSRGNTAHYFRSNPKFPNAQSLCGWLYPKRQLEPPGELQRCKKCLGRLR